MWQVEKISSMNCLKYCAVVFASLFLSLACGNDGGTVVSELKSGNNPKHPASPRSPRGSSWRFRIPDSSRKWILRELLESGKKTDAWQTDRAVFTYEPQGGFNGSAGIRIACTEGDYTTDAVVTQSVSRADSRQTLRTFGYGAHLRCRRRPGRQCLPVRAGCLDWIGPFPGPMVGRRSVQFIAEESTAVIGCRLGFWAGDSREPSGLTMSRSVRPRECTTAKASISKCTLEKALVRVSDGVMDGWLAKLDKVYDAYTELFDFFRAVRRTEDDRPFEND